MTNEQKAKIILESMDKNGIQINWNMEKYYIDGIVKGLKEIDKRKPIGDDKYQELKNKIKKD